MKSTKVLGWGSLCEYCKKGIVNPSNEGEIGKVAKLPNGVKPTTGGVVFTNPQDGYKFKQWFKCPFCGKEAGFMFEGE